MSGRRVQPERLQTWCEQVLRAVGMTADGAALLASSLVDADARGIRTHGVIRLPIYVRRMRAGILAPRPRITVERRGASSALVDAGDGPGQLAAHRATEEAVALARTTGAGVVAVRRSSHFGAAGWYTRLVAEQGMAGMALSHAEADMIPFGGRERSLGTNPVSLAVPGPPGEPPVVLDMASSAVPMGRVLLARDENAALPAGWAVDAAGAPTQDPHQAVGVLPLGGPKGHGLAVIIDLLSALLTGAAFGRDIRRMYDDFSGPQGLGHLVIAVAIDPFVPLAVFRERVGAFRDHLRAVPAAEGFDGVLLPGEPEQAALVASRRGVTIAGKTLRSLAAVGDELDVAFRLEG